MTFQNIFSEKAIVLQEDFLNFTNDKKIRMVESEMRSLRGIKQYKEIVDNIVLSEYNGKSIRMKGFTFLYHKKLLILLKGYYFFRAFFKKMLKK